MVALKVVRKVKDSGAKREAIVGEVRVERKVEDSEVAATVVRKVEHVAVVSVMVEGEEDSEVVVPMAMEVVAMVEMVEVKEMSCTFHCPKTRMFA